MASRDGFIDDLVARGFARGDDENVLRGPIGVPDGRGGQQLVEHDIWLPTDFPFAGPKVRPVTPVPCPEWHLEPTGYLCLYPDHPRTLPDWDEPDALFKMVAGWYAEHSAGWPSDPGDLDLERYFPKRDHGLLIVYNDELDTLVDRRLKVNRLPVPGGYTVARGRRIVVDSHAHRRRDERDTSDFWGACIDLGTLDKPVDDWRSVSRRITPEVRDELLRLARAHGNGIILARYARQVAPGRAAGVAMRMSLARGTNVPDLTALEVEDRSTATRNRRGTAWLRLQQADVALVGCGAIGSFLAANLVLAGVGRLTLVDGDRLRFGNCVRHLADTSMVHLNKACAVELTLRSRAAIANCTVTTIADDMTGANAAEVIAGRTLVIDATANERVRGLLEVIAKKMPLTIVSVALFRSGAVARVDRLGQGTAHWDKRLPPVLSSGYEGVPESGCGDPVSPTPPSSVVAAASLAARVAVDTIVQPRTRRSYRDSVAETLVADPTDAEYGVVGVRQQ